MTKPTHDRVPNAFPALPANTRVESSAGTLEGHWSPSQLAMLAALRQTKYRVKSAWSGHLPFAFSIVALHRPRRLVELGTHRGASFFAFCEAMKEFDVDGQCIAIDHWLGDSQAGSMGDEVFESVGRVLRKDFADLASTLRTSFSDAAPHFEDGSVDLLHIDGFHTYDAVTTDYATWLPKMSDRGVILFHDINEHQESFGVWRLWSELTRAYPARTFAFGHSHGLGVLSLDDDASSTVNRFLLEAASAETGTFLQQFFTTAALSQERARLVTAGAIERERNRANKLSDDAFATRQQEGLTHRSADIEAAKAEEIEAINAAHEAELQQVVARHEAIVTAITSSRSWRVTAPLRWMSRGLRGGRA